MIFCSAMVPLQGPQRFSLAEVLNQLEESSKTLNVRLFFQFLIHDNFYLGLRV
jgi:hypothetical protein